MFSTQALHIGNQDTALSGLCSHALMPVFAHTEIHLMENPGELCVRLWTFFHHGFKVVLDKWQEENCGNSKQISPQTYFLHFALMKKEKDQPGDPLDVWPKKEYGNLDLNSGPKSSFKTACKGARTGAS